VGEEHAKQERLLIFERKRAAVGEHGDAGRAERVDLDRGLAIGRHHPERKR